MIAAELGITLTADDDHNHDFDIVLVDPAEGFRIMREADSKISAVELRVFGQANKETNAEYWFTYGSELLARVGLDLDRLPEGDAPSTQQARAMLDEQAAVIRDAWQRIPGT